MLCPRCYGARRLVEKVLAGQGHTVIEYHEISLCPLCNGVGQIDCCDGDCEQPMSREAAMLAATDVNPNG